MKLFILTFLFLFDDEVYKFVHHVRVDGFPCVILCYLNSLIFNYPINILNLWANL